MSLEFAELDSSTIPEVAKRSAPPALRLAFSFPVALSSLLLLLIVMTVRCRFNDPDMWWHLKTGEMIWNTHHIPAVDTFSYTVAGRPWILQEWLAQLTIYTAYHFGGYTGMMLWLCAIGSALLIGGYALCSVYSGNAKVAFLGAMIIWLFSTVGLSIRPHMIGYLCLTGELLLLHLGRTRDQRWFYALPPLFCLWINVHSSFILGLVILAVVIFCSFLEFRTGLLTSSRWATLQRRSLFISSGISVAALFLNPIGPKLIFYPIDVMLNQHVNLGAVSEWQQPQFGSPRGMAFLAVAALILLLPILRRVEITLQEVLLLALGFGFAVRHDRMLFLFGILVAPLLCRLLADTWENYQFDTDRITPNAVMVVMALGIAVLAFPNAKNLSLQVELANPVKALDFLRRSRIEGRMLNDYVSGGYLIWAAPERKVFIDGRADIYDPAGVMAEFGEWAMLQADTAAFLHRRDIQYCLLARDAPVARTLQLMPEWKAVYSDQLSVIFIKRRADA